MARPVEIDRDEAVDAAMREFWRRGYAATTVPQLLDATGMGAGSFYAAFGNKAALFRRALDRYSTRYGARLAAIRGAHRGLSAVRAFLEQTLIDAEDDTRGQGCLVVNTALECAGIDDTLARRSREHLASLRASLLELLGEARQLDELRHDLDLEDGTDLLVALIHGLRVDCRIGLSRQEAERRVSTAIRLLQSTVPISDTTRSKTP